MEQRAIFLITYAAQHGPATVRQLYYQAEVRGLPGIDKTEGGYDKVQRQVQALRRAGRLPYTDIADLTRWMRKPTTYDGIEAALQDTARFYRKALWIGADTYIEVWCEKDALAGVIFPVHRNTTCLSWSPAASPARRSASKQSRPASATLAPTMSGISATSIGPVAMPPSRWRRNYCALVLSAASTSTSANSQLRKWT
jgi:hypothetical protein